jgi:hypothetical protein
MGETKSFDNVAEIDQLRRAKDPNRNAWERFLYRVGQKHLEVNVALGLMSVDNKRALKPYEVRRKGFLTSLVIGGLATTGSLIAYNMLDYEEPKPTVPAPATACEFSTETTIVQRQVGEGDGSLAVRTIDGVNWGQCSTAAQEWIEDHNPDMTHAVDETVVVPQEATVVTVKQ